MAIKISEVSTVGYRQGYATGFAEEDLQVAFCAEVWVRSKGSSSPGGSEPADCSCRPAGQREGMGTGNRSAELRLGKAHLG